MRAEMRLPESRCYMYDKSREIFYEVQGEFATVGRASNNDVVLKGGTVSRYHALLTISGSDYWLQDCSSKHGTRINHRKITSSSIVRAGDLIQIGLNELELVIVKLLPAI